ncbi:BolA family transcriptional regulator [bacterium]|nr:BolA family transcriptional regulator [bacterium]
MKIEELLEQQITAEFIEVTDESWQHGGGPEAQSHFKIVLVSGQFEGQKLLARHRLVQSILAEIVGRVRAISLHTLTPAEWQKAEENDVSFRSPGCHNKK